MNTSTARVLSRGSMRDDDNHDAKNILEAGSSDYIALFRYYFTITYFNHIGGIWIFAVFANTVANEFTTIE